MILRGGFLKLFGAGFASLLFNPSLDNSIISKTEHPNIVGRARVATPLIYRYSRPSLRSERLGTLRRDHVVTIFEEITSPDGPIHNSRWYRLANGYVHSGWLQRVDNAHFHTQPLTSVPEQGQLGRICVPYTQSYRRIRKTWEKLYRLYYQSVHWITDLDTGPEGTSWYRLTDDLLHAHHYVPARHVEPINTHELVPISRSVDPDDKRVEVSIDEQTLTAFEQDQPVLQVKVSTGIPSDPVPGLLPTETPRGRFRIQTKMPSRHMGDGILTSDPDAYELPGVPWVCFFHRDGIAFHGTYWHDNFGRMMSHGCVNMRNEDALWLYRWTTPAISPQDWYTRGLGTLVDII